MLIRDDKEYRNIQQQVAKNTSDIQDLKEGSGFDIDAYTKEESDAKFQTKTAMSDYYTKTVADSTFQTQSGMSTYATKAELNAKQDTLVSGTNIKTINGTSVLGSGDIIIGEGGTTVTGGTGIIVSNEGEISIDTSVVAELSDIPTVPTKTSQLTNDSGFITGINSTDVTTALGYTPGTSNFSGDYDDLTDKPDLSVYELAANAFSGNYNDLTNKPTIPAAVSGTNNGVDWTSITIGNNTYAIPSATAGSHLYRHNIQLSGTTSSNQGYIIYFDIYNNDSTTYTSLANILNALNDGTTGFTGDRITCNGLIASSASTQYRPLFVRKDANDSSWLDAVYYYYSNTSVTFNYIIIASTQTGFSITDTLAKIY